MSSTPPDSNQPLPRQVIEGEARLFDLLYLRVSQGDAAVSAAVVKTIDPNGPMKALWIMASVNVARRRQRLSFFMTPLRFFGRGTQPYHPEPTTEEALQALADAVRKKLGTQEAAVKAA